MNDDGLIHDLHEAQALDEVLEAYQERGEIAGDAARDLATILPAFDPDSAFIDQLDRQLQVRHRAKQRRRRYRLYVAVAAALLLVAIGGWQMIAYLSTPDDGQATVIAGATATPLPATTRMLLSTAVAVNPTATQVGKTATPTPLLTATPPGTATTTPTSTPTATSSPSPQASPSLVTSTSLPTTTPSSTATVSGAIPNIAATAIPSAPALYMEIDDNIHFEDYLRYREQFLASGLASDAIVDMDVTERHIIRVTDANSRPVANARITVADEDGVNLTQLQTNAQGITYFFPGVYLARAERYQVIVETAVGQITGSFAQVEAQWNFILSSTVESNPPIQVIVLSDDSILTAQAGNFDLEDVAVRFVESLADVQMDSTAIQIVFVSGASSMPADQNYASLSLFALENGIKIHTFLAFDHAADSEFIMRQIAQLTGGKFFTYQSPTILPTLIQSLVREEINS